jgi:hypothetical protein
MPVTNNSALSYIHPHRREDEGLPQPGGAQRRGRADRRRTEPAAVVPADDIALRIAGEAAAAAAGGGAHGAPGPDHRRLALAGAGAVADDLPAGTPAATTAVNERGECAQSPRPQHRVRAPGFGASAGCAAAGSVPSPGFDQRGERTRLRQRPRRVGQAGGEAGGASGGGGVRSARNVRDAADRRAARAAAAARSDWWGMDGVDC